MSRIVTGATRTPDRTPGWTGRREIPVPEGRPNDSNTLTRNRKDGSLRFDTIFDYP